MSRTHAGAAPAKHRSDNALATLPIWLEWLTLGGMLAFGGWRLAAGWHPDSGVD